MSNTVQKKKAGGNSIGMLLLKARTFIALFILLIFFSFKAPNFTEWSSIVLMVKHSSIYGLLALGMTLVIITGGIDLSVGAVAGLSGMIAGGLMIEGIRLPGVAGTIYPNVPLILLVVFVLAIIIGLFSGFLIARMNVPAFIATLCTMLITRGLSSVACGGASISWPARASEGGWFRNIFKYMMPNALGKKTPIPIGLIVVIAAVIIRSIMLKKTRVGRYIIAIGSNKEAARLSGVNVTKYQMFAYIISGLFAGIAGIAFAASNASSITASSGLGLELDAIGGAIIGGTSMTGGSGSIVGSMIGILILALLKNGLPKIGLTGDWQHVITGIILFAAIWFDVIKNRKKA